MDVSQLLKWDSEPEPKKVQDKDKDKDKDKSSYQLSDKLIEKLFAMALPPSMTNMDSNDLLKDRTKSSSERPPLSLPTMSKNFIQLNSRLSAPFELINNIIYFLQWKNPFMTITILLIYTHIIIHPIPFLVVILPVIIIQSMTPNFLACYKPDIINSIPNNPSQSRIKNLQPIKPTSELSKEFMLNLTDLQNHMLLYVDVWDLVVHGLNKFINWEDETISSFIFLLMILFTIFTFIFGELLTKIIEPLTKVFLIFFGWGMVLSIHPRFYDSINNFIYSESTRLYILKKTNKFEESLNEKIETFDDLEVREVGIFEVWKLNELENEWNFIGFKNSAFWSNDIHRITYDHDGKVKSRSDLSINNFKTENDEGDDSSNEDDLEKEAFDVSFSSSVSTHTSTSLNKIVPPVLWKFKPNSNWKVDLFPDLWIKEDLLSEDSSSINIDNEGKWVYDKNNVMGKYKRRRWTRDVIRISELNDDTLNEFPEKTSQVQSQKKRAENEPDNEKTRTKSTTTTLRLTDTIVESKAIIPRSQSLNFDSEAIKNIRKQFVDEQIDYMI